LRNHLKHCNLLLAAGEITPVHKPRIFP
jgi:hypothetical protein